MSCNLTSGIALDCINGLGGVKEMYVFAGTWGGITEVAGEVTLISGQGAFYTMELPKDTASFTESINVAPTAGTIFYQPELTAIFQKMEAAKRNQILLLAQNRDLRVVFVDNNDVTWLMGESRGCQVSAGTSTTGTAVADANSYSITIQGQEPLPVFPVDGTLADVIGSGVTIVAAP